jgi:hypothetical protein
MRAFACPRCGQLVFFENVVCLRCGSALGFDPDSREMVLVGGPEGVAEHSRCANQQLAGCNWLVPDPSSGGLCRSCRLTRTRPNDADLAVDPSGADPSVSELFVRAEAAKRRLVFQLLELNLPVVALSDDPDTGLAFEFLVRKGEPIMIGHDNGVITIDLAESDDAYRERMRTELSEPYRTMLGHLRHEVGHYYWQVLVLADDEVLGGFRGLFGDERDDYQQALERHYDQGPPLGWAQDHVSAYAATHPWEDWAESWAHYLHIRDTLQTAAAHGIIVTGPRFRSGSADAAVDHRLEASLMAAPPLDLHQSVDEILDDWLPLTYALNAINRSMGKEDLYPFVLSPKVIDKLRFVHQRVVGSPPLATRRWPTS